MILGWRSEAAERASRRKRSRIFSSRLKVGSRSLIATARSRPSCVASNTAPIPPRLISRSIRYRPASTAPDCIPYQLSRVGSLGDGGLGSPSNTSVIISSPLSLVVESGECAANSIHLFYAGLPGSDSFQGAGSEKRKRRRDGGTEGRRE